MANIKLDDIPEEKRKAVKLIAELGGFGDDYAAVNNASYKNEMLLYDLNRFIESKRFKLIINTLKNEYPFMDFEKTSQGISDDERLLRRSLRQFDFVDDNFFNPKYDKGELVSWDETSDRNKVFKINSSFKDSGVNYYDLRNIDTGIVHGGRIREDELREPSVIEAIEYYKKQEMLEVHLFNRLIPLDKVTKEDGLALIEALKGIDIEHDNEDIREIAYAAQKGFIDKQSHFNTLCMIGETFNMINNPIQMVALRDDEVNTNDILVVEELAKNNIEIIDKYRTIYKDIKALKKELNYNVGIEDKELKDVMVDISLAIDKSYDKFDSSEIGKAFGNAYWDVRPNNPEVFKKIEAIYEKSFEFTQERDIHKLNRPDLNDLIRGANLQLDLSRKDMILFRGSRNAEFNYDTLRGAVINNLQGSNIAELNVANNGFRREFYQAPSQNHGGSNFGYCEGDLTLEVPKNIDEFNQRLERGVNFYCEDEGKSIEERSKCLTEMNDKLGINALVCQNIYEKIQNNEQVPSSEFSKVDFESEAFKSLDSDMQETITNYINTESDKIIQERLDEQKQQQSTSVDVSL